MRDDFFFILISFFFLSFNRDRDNRFRTLAVGANNYWNNDESRIDSGRTKNNPC